MNFRHVVTAMAKDQDGIKIVRLEITVDCDKGQDPIEVAADIVCSKEGILWDDYTWSSSEATEA
jgi:hypothetical protein